MAVFGLSFSSNSSTLCYYYCTAAFCLPFGQEIRERSRGLQLGFSYLFHVADWVFRFGKFSIYILNAALGWILISDALLLHLQLNWFNRLNLKLSLWSYVIIKIIKPHLYCLPTCRLDYNRGAFTEWQHIAEITNSWQRLQCWSLHNVKDLYVPILKISQWLLNRLILRNTTAVNLFSCLLCLWFVLCCTLTSKAAFVNTAAALRLFALKADGICSKETSLQKQGCWVSVSR